MEETKPKGRITALKEEFAKIFWPDKASVGKQTLAVIVLTAILGIIIVFFDMVIQLGLDKLFSL